MFQKLLSKWKERYDRIIVDSPPLTIVTDATVLASRLDGVTIVVKASQTRKEAFEDAVHGIRKLGGNIIGAVLNGVSLENRGYGYHRYHYYAKDGCFSGSNGNGKNGSSGSSSGTLNDDSHCSHITTA